MWQRSARSHELLDVSQPCETRTYAFASGNYKSKSRDLCKMYLVLEDESTGSELHECRAKMSTTKTYPIITGCLNKS